VASNTVIWAGALPRTQLSSPPANYVTHALDCKWLLTVEARDHLSLPRVPAQAVPSTVGRCRKCGGGR